MITIRVPATTANLGTGFDCLGLALSLYNRFDVELSDQDILENAEEHFNGPDNLFLQAYHKGCEEIGVHDCVHVVFHCDIPVSRGLGSSAALITGGLMAASHLHGNALGRDRIFSLAAQSEHHPDNAAPAVCGGLTACLDLQTMRSLPLSDKWHLTVFIPDVEISTERARATLPASYAARDTFSAVSRAIMTVQALEHGDMALLQRSCQDVLHEPYRKGLIPDFDAVRDLVLADTDGVFLISGSGSTCLLISIEELSSCVIKQIRERSHPSWQIMSLSADMQGAVSEGVKKQDRQLSQK